jgi:hypothetical protein
VAAIFLTTITFDYCGGRDVFAAKGASLDYRSRWTAAIEPLALRAATLTFTAPRSHRAASANAAF